MLNWDLEGGRSSLRDGELDASFFLSPLFLAFPSSLTFDLSSSSFSLSSSEECPLPSSTVSLLPSPLLSSLVASNRTDSRSLFSLSSFAEKMMDRYGMQGSCATYCRTQCDMICKIPKTMTFEEACCMPSCMMMSFQVRFVPLSLRLFDSR